MFSAMELLHDRSVAQAIESGSRKCGDVDEGRK